MQHTLDSFSKLLLTIKDLLSEKGCPWDKRQTNHSLLKYLTSELNELIQAINTNNHENTCEELGDLVYLILLFSEINHQNGHFTLADVLQAVNRKLIRRHPHVFVNPTALSDEELKAQWLAIKAQEKAENLN